MTSEEPVLRTIYRIENQAEMHGMWYDREGNFDPIINRLCPNALAGNFPMDGCPDHRRESKVWYSAGKNRENMNQWFSKEDALALAANGFQLFEFVVAEYYEKEMEILFTREGVVSCREIPFEEIWP